MMQQEREYEKKERIWGYILGWITREARSESEKIKSGGRTVTKVNREAPRAPDPTFTQATKTKSRKGGMLFGCGKLLHKCTAKRTKMEAQDSY